VCCFAALLLCRDRVPYITDLRHGPGKPSIVPKDRHIHHNLILATYNSQQAIDTDDGSAYIKIHENFLGKRVAG
jgi:hypothetical protein